jgi:signal transduction histidine kinase
MGRTDPANRAQASSGETAFAPAERAGRPAVEASIAAFAGHPVMQALLDATGASILVLNRERQIVVGNAALLASLDLKGIESVEGMRPGEAFGCVHAGQCSGGCGTSPECSACGTVLAILASQVSGRASEQECLMTVRRNGQLEAFELQVRASQLALGGETFTVLALRDVSAEKRRAALERVFLHDISTTLGSLLLRSQALSADASGATADAARKITSLADRMRRELEDQRVLIQAETGTLEVKRAPVAPEDALDAAAAVLIDHPVARGRTLEVVRNGRSGPVVTDESLLVRVLVNMMKNALEATPPTGVVKAWAREPVPGFCELQVRNETAIEPRVSLQIFKRSFSTKPGRGRGLGTFSMKLFGERYLGGTVGFTSTEGSGTTFFIRLPYTQ